MDENIASTDEFSHPVYSKNVIEFVTVANEFCKIAENSSKFDKRMFIDKSQKIMALLYLKTSMLPKTESISEFDNEKFVSEYDYDFIKDSIAKKFGSHNLYIDISDAVMNEELALSEISLSECIADIYQDLKNFITLYRIGTVEAMNDGLWECSLNFEHVWGQRVIKVLGSLHQLHYLTDDLDDDMDTEEKSEDEFESAKPWFS